MRWTIGPVADIAEDRCRAIADGAAVVFRIGEDVQVFDSRCLHQNSSLDGGWIRDGVLSCPLHFWRYDSSDGTLLGSDGVAALGSHPVVITDGIAEVELPDPPPAASIRQQQLDHAARWKAEHQDRQRQPRSD